MKDNAAQCFLESPVKVGMALVTLLPREQVSMSEAQPGFHVNQPCGAGLCWVPKASGDSG